MPALFSTPVPPGRNVNRGVEAAFTILAPRLEHVLPRLRLRHRDTDGEAGLNPLIAIVVVLAAITLIISAIVFLKCRRNKRRKYQEAGNLEPYSSTTAGRSGNRRLGPGGANAVSEANRGSATSNINRNTSIRSIITLPRYTNTANEGEQVLGRGGERDGVDRIVELPSVAEQEALRDEEMETMYQIRLARTQQNAEREERRRLTQAARDRGDRAALEELRARRRAEYEDTTVENLREAQSQLQVRRERAVSSVSYHEIGIARHDGSRIRANSSESERVGLLSDAASISASVRPPSTLSNYRPADNAAPGLDARSPSAQSQHHMRSVSSMLSLDENGDVSPHSGAATPRLGSSPTHAGSSPEIVTEADLGDNLIPPPDYEDVNLNDERSHAATPIPINEPPPSYSQGNSENESGDLASLTRERRRQSSYRSTRGVGGVPQLPSLRIRELPRIIIEPSTALSGESER
ncbi:hypothetical protein GGS21DRAFT_449769 [Xylaria nigripes]|nr:hypothetical protein GGS21DRAFT_449769 [Xylaria nigripes]